MKEKITMAQAWQILRDTLDEMDWGDKIWEFAEGLFSGHVQYINDHYELTDADEYGGGTGIEWYDEFYEQFHDAVYAGLLNFLKNGQ